MSSRSNPEPARILGPDPVNGCRPLSDAKWGRQVRHFLLTLTAFLLAACSMVQPTPTPLGTEQTSQVRMSWTGLAPVAAWATGSAPAPMTLTAAGFFSDGGGIWWTVPFKTAPTSVSRMDALALPHGLAAFVWAVRSGQFDDTTTPAVRVALDDTGRSTPHPKP